MNELQTLPPKPKGFKRMSDIFGNGKNTNSRNSRDVHKYLGVTTAYSRWIKRRIESLGAEENIDFAIAKNGKGDLGQFESFDYIVTDDFAKHLGMVEKTDKGKQVRDYFIYMEKLAQYLIMKTCNQKEVQFKLSQAETKKAQSNNRKVYKDGFMSLTKYIKDNDLNLKQSEAFKILNDIGAIEYRETTTIRAVLVDETLGRQIDFGVIEFNSRALDSIFETSRPKTLFEGS